MSANRELADRMIRAVEEIWPDEPLTTTQAEILAEKYLRAGATAGAVDAAIRSAYANRPLDRRPDWELVERIAMASVRRVRPYDDEPRFDSPEAQKIRRQNAAWARRNLHALADERRRLKPSDADAAPPPQLVPGRCYAVRWRGYGEFVATFEGTRGRVPDGEPYAALVVVKGMICDRVSLREPGDRLSVPMRDAIFVECHPETTEAVVGTVPAGQPA